MLNYQIRDDTVNLTFSKELLSSPEIARFIETLRIKELLTNSQVSIDDELKKNWVLG